MRWELYNLTMGICNSSTCVERIQIVPVNPLLFPISCKYGHYYCRHQYPAIINPEVFRTHLSKHTSIIPEIVEIILQYTLQACFIHNRACIPIPPEHVLGIYRRKRFTDKEMKYLLGHSAGQGAIYAPSSRECVDPNGEPNGEECIQGDVYCIDKGVPRRCPVVLYSHIIP